MQFQFLIPEIVVVMDGDSDFLRDTLSVQCVVQGQIKGGKQLPPRAGIVVSGDGLPTAGIRALFLAKFVLASRLDAVVVLDNSYRKKKIIFPKPATNAQPQGP